MAPHQIVVLALACLLVVFGGLLFFWYRYWHLPREVQRHIVRLGREEAAGIPPSPADYRYLITCDDNGFTVADLRQSNPNVSVRWSEIDQVTAFKRDEFTVDCICLLIGAAKDPSVELNEEMAGWKSLVEVLPTFLAGCRPFEKWFFTVAFPAFETNATEIYRRGLSESSKAGAGTNNAS